MERDQIIFKELEKVGFKVSTDTRQDLGGTIFFALKGENFDGSLFANQALGKGALVVVTENSEIKGEKIFYVENVLSTLQTCARMYREQFKIPIIAIGGSNGKTTTRDLITQVLGLKYKVHSSKENLNNHIGLPLTILSMPQETEIGVFEIGANHPGEHLELLEILKPTIVLVTNNGLDHLEGFGSPEGVRKANKEIYDWALTHGVEAFVDKGQNDLLEDSQGLERVLYPEFSLEKTGGTTLGITFLGINYQTHLVGDYNLNNINAALAFGNFFSVGLKESLSCVASYEPTLKRSQFMKVGENNIILDCYNANPSSMKLALESFIQSTSKPRGIILGDMLELGSYSEAEHCKVVDFISQKDLDQVILIGGHFKKALTEYSFNHHWFANSEEAGNWFKVQAFKGHTFLLKGSRGSKVEKVLGM